MAIRPRIPQQFPFGQPLHRLEQIDRSPKPVFVLGIRGSSVHACWSDPDGRVLVRALAVASEPTLYWRGEGAERIIEQVDLPPGAGSLAPAGDSFNGASGRALDEVILDPLGLSRDRTWLCDLIPHACLNPAQQADIAREYEPRREALGLPEVSLLPVPETLDDERREEILAELLESQAEVLIVLGNQPLRDFLAPLCGASAQLSRFGTDADTYGRLHDIEIAARRMRLLPLADPSRVGVRYPSRWRSLHEAWMRYRASQVLDSVE